VGVSLFVLAVSLFVTYHVRAFAIARKIGVYPNERMVHTGFIPRLGGLGIITGVLAGVVALMAIYGKLWSPAQTGILLGSIIMALVGVLDDMRGLNAPQKISMQFIAATVVILSGNQIQAFLNPFGAFFPLGYFALPVTYLWLIGVTNSLNLLDGLDGLAAGVSLIAALAFALIAWHGGQINGALLCLLLVVGLLGFLKFNYHPASIFMGDTGSLFLGFFLASMALNIFDSGHGHVNLLLPIIILAVPIGDTIVAFLRRLIRGRHPFKPDKDHLHHRLIYLGLTHLQAVLIICMAATLYTVVALLITFNVLTIGYGLFLLALVFSTLGLKRLGYLEARRFKTVYGDKTKFRVKKEAGPLSLNRFLHRLLLVATDLIAINLALVSLVKIRTLWHLPAQSVMAMDSVISAGPMFVISLFWLALFFLNDLYSMRWDVSRFDKIRRVTKTLIFGLLLVFLLTWDSAAFLSAGRLSVLIYGFFLFTYINALRLIVIGIEKKWGVLEYAPKNTLLVGTSDKARGMLKNIRRNPHLLYQVVGFVNEEGSLKQFSNLKKLGGYTEIPDIIRTHGVQEVIIALNTRSLDDILEIMARTENMKIVYKLIPQFYDIVSGHKTEDVLGHPLIRLFPDQLRLWQWIVKRALDITVASSLFLMLLPVGFLVYVFLKFSGAHPALEIVNRVGKNKRMFGMLNFNVNLPRNRAQEFIYRSNIYKLPELLNILIGSMSLVGPRPQSLEFVKTNSRKIKFYTRRFLVRPGLTGWAQVNYRYDTTLKLQREQHRHDLYYLENMSINFDFRIILRSLYIFLFNGGNLNGK